MLEKSPTTIRIQCLNAEIKQHAVDIAPDTLLAIGASFKLSTESKPFRVQASAINWRNKSKKEQINRVTSALTEVLPSVIGSHEIPLFYFSVTPGTTLTEVSLVAMNENEEIFARDTQLLPVRTPQT